MSFILKNDPTVINIKLTAKGREMLAKGKLRFAQWGVGDSEIDYTFNKINNFDGVNSNILKAKNNNPNFLSFIRKDQNSSSGNTLPTVVANTSILVNPTDSRGFFEEQTGTTKFKLRTAPSYIKQADIKIYISGVTGSTTLKIKQASTYSGNIVEPVVGDYILVKWANPLLTGGSVTANIDKKIPMVWYKIHQIVSGTLSANNLRIIVDKKLPNFNGQGGSIASGAFILPNSNLRTTVGDSVVTYYGNPIVYNFGTDAINTFFENDNICTVDVPVWNMSIIFTEEVAGVLNGNRNVKQYYSLPYAGFVKYIETISSSIKNIGLIHYTNDSPSNLYGEGFHASTPILELPTVLWHNSTGKTIGLVLTADTKINKIPILLTEYRDLIDKNRNVVGKVFNDLKLFVIEDQELLFAMSYKTNRNWTLPAALISFSGTICDNPACLLMINSITKGSGSITINASNGFGSLLYSIDNGNTYSNQNTFTGLPNGTYNIIVTDTGIANCFNTAVVILP